jgi:hypothetical protein
MFLFKFCWFIVTGIIRVTVLVGISLFLLVHADDGIDKLKSTVKAGSDRLISEMREVDATHVLHAAEDRLYVFLSERRRSRD